MISPRGSVYLSPWLVDHVQHLSATDAKAYRRHANVLAPEDLHVTGSEWCGRCQQALPSLKKIQAARIPPAE